MEDAKQVPKPSKKRTSKSIHANVPSPPRIVKEKVQCKTGRNYIRKYKRGKLLGKGGFARCYELMNTETGKTYAAKVVSKQTLVKARTKEKV